MSILSDGENSYPEEEQDGGRGGKGGGIGAIILFVLLALPALISAILVFQMLRVLRLRPSLISFVSASIIAVIAAMWAIFDYAQLFSRYFSSWESAQTIIDNWDDLLWPVISVYIVIGVIFGWIYTLVQARSLVKKPELLAYKGSWSYNFKYRKTPVELWRRKQRIQGLKEGKYRGDTESPLGLDETDKDVLSQSSDEIVSRHDEESVLHTLLTGASGSGKSLEKDTLIPTIDGMRTVETVKKGDILFDEHGNETEVLEKFQPMVKGHYLISFSDGTEIKACSDHLWNVERLDKTVLRDRDRNPFLTEKEHEELKRKVSLSTEGETVTFNEIVRMFDSLPHESTILRMALENLVPEVKQGSSLYVSKELKSKIVRTRLKYLTEDDKKKWVEAIENYSRELIPREELLKYSDNGIGLTQVARDIEGNTIPTEHLYDRKSALSIVLEDNEDRMNHTYEKSLTQTGDRPVETIDTKSLYETGVRFGKESKKSLRYAVRLLDAPVSYRRQEDLPLDPYVLGAWLGDGYSRTGSICGVDLEVKEKIIKNGFSLQSESIEEKGHRTRKQDFYIWNFGIRNNLKEMDLLIPAYNIENLVNKDIPDQYLISSEEQRVELLSGLMDTDGWVNKDGSSEFGMTNKKVVEKARMVVSSMGWYATRIHSKHPYAVKNDGTRSSGKEFFSFSFYPDRQIFNVGRKAERLEKRLLDHENLSQQIRHRRRYITDIEPIEDNPENYYCFTVDSPSSLFLCSESYIKTHNTISMLSLIKADIYAGRPVIVIDLKRSPDLASKLAKWAHDNEEEHGSEFYHFVNGDKESYDIPYSPGQAYYDPLKTGNTTSKADMILGMREYDQASAVYKSSMQRLLSVLFSMLEKVRQLREYTGNTDLCSSLDWDNGGIYLLSSASKTENFVELLNTVMKEFAGEDESGMAKEILAETSKRNSMLSHALGELQGQMQTIVASEYGQWLKTEPGSHSIDLFEASKKPGNVILFSLNSDDEKEFSRFLGSIIMADITRASASRRNASTEDLVNIYIDEFQILVPDTVTDLLEKARASAMGVTLAQQSLSQVMKGIVGDGEAYLQSILDTCSNFIFHSGSGQDTAERMSKIVGEEWVEVYSVNRRRDNFIFSINWWNNRRLLVNTSKEKRNRIEPQKFMHLSAPSSSNDYRSEAIVIKKAGADDLFYSDGGSVAKEVWMIPDQEILEKHYTPTNAETKRIFSESHVDLDDVNLLPTSVYSATSRDAADDIQNHIKKGKIQKLRGVNNRGARPAPEGIVEEEEDVEPYFRGLDPEVEDDTAYVSDPADDEDDVFTEVPERSGSSSAGSVNIEDSSDDVDGWSLEDILEDEDDEEDGITSEEPGESLTDAPSNKKRTLPTKKNKRSSSGSSGSNSGGLSSVVSERKSRGLAQANQESRSENSSENRKPRRKKSKGLPILDDMD